MASIHFPYTHILPDSLRRASYGGASRMGESSGGAAEQQLRPERVLQSLPGCSATRRRSTVFATVQANMHIVGVRAPGCK